MAETAVKKVTLDKASDGSIIKKYVELRDIRAQRKKAFDEEDVADKIRMEKLENELLRRLNERGVDSTSSKEFGTAYKKVTTSCSAADWEAFVHDFVIPNQAWDFLTQRPNKTAVAAYVEEHGDLPPGLNWGEYTTIGIRRS